MWSSRAAIAVAPSSNRRRPSLSSCRAAGWVTMDHSLPPCRLTDGPAGLRGLPDLLAVAIAKQIRAGRSSIRPPAEFVGSPFARAVPRLELGAGVVVELGAGCVGAHPPLWAVEVGPPRAQGWLLSVPGGRWCWQNFLGLGQDVQLLDPTASARLLARVPLLDGPAARTMGVGIGSPASLRARRALVDEVDRVALHAL